MKWYSYSYSIVHPIEYEYEYCPSCGVRVRKTQGNCYVMFKVVGKDEDEIRGRIRDSIAASKSVECDYTNPFGMLKSNSDFWAQLLNEA